jgi:UDP-2-acetamido-2,6-beta-L-arabino-hexul-4-ose reductase
MYKVGITGQKGFVGSHLYNYLGLKADITLIDFEKSMFDNPEKLLSFVKQCDVIVHLAAMNRHEDAKVIYDTNVNLVDKLVAACSSAKVAPHIIFSSSTQESNENLYGKSKKVGRELFESWSDKSGGKTTGLVIPNVFGPFGKPYYNSVVATFCHQLTHDETPVINSDGTLKLIYINELISEIYQVIVNKTFGRIEVKHTKEIKVSEILEILQSFKSLYLESGVFPDLTHDFEKALFNTFRCFIPTSYYPRAFKNNIDQRGNFVEIARTNSTGQFSFSTTVPGITRGNHFHTRKAERFAVIKGQALIQLRKIGTQEVINYYLNGENPSYVDMPIWYTHNIKNIGQTELVTLFWINEPYDDKDPDTYFVNV